METIMTKTTLWTLLLSFALTSAAFAATDVEKCQKKKLLALGKRDLCLQKERGKEVLGKTPNLAGCAEKFDKMVAAAEKKSTCRWLDNGDGTATDLNSGLQWELKTGDGSIHDFNNLYTWSDTTSDPDGGAFVDFLGTLNGGESASGVTTTGCFADKCDWRLATIEELADIVDLAAFNCGSFPCTTIPGETQGGAYWSSSTDSADPDGAWGVHFAFGLSGSGLKDHLGYVRAVRGGS
jgi:hypothetical protein